ncbi:hypothetical protein RYZ26_07550 [Terasakiella sp. A23]|uniref:hypothetical protein n=1 Tax=Terasakiella sp. FCG-A23 TaxID=3080561 RepID=UPI002955055A|nr:hypothetical protein [Terasakiella sp. A23]MDV7339441.1 hypothetical protein [Terasakiella sp. A23]
MTQCSYFSEGKEILRDLHEFLDMALIHDHNLTNQQTKAVIKGVLTSAENQLKLKESSAKTHDVSICENKVESARQKLKEIASTLNGEEVTDTINMLTDWYVGTFLPDEQNCLACNAEMTKPA